MIIVTVALHVVYAYRNHARWARAAADFLKVASARQTDTIILAWAILGDIAVIFFWVLITHK
jgi:hypothetical protein